MQGQIIKALAGFYYVESDGQVYQTRARGNFRKKGHTPYVGDLVDFSAEENSEGYILKIHERKNSLVRPPIVNIDQAVVIMSVKEPDFNSNLLDRFLVLLEHKGIHPIVYISKMDLLEDGGELDFYEQTYGAIGYDFMTSKEELLPLLTDKVTVFMGQTRVGKSTLLNIFLGNLKDYEGKILFGKLESKEIDENSIVSECAYVGSQTHIYNDTLRNNLTLWNEAITDTQIKKVLERVNLLSFLNRIDEQVSDGSFSEGQKQRIGLIRAFLKGCSVVIFDEATANLDHNNATRIEHLLLSDPNITYITVTHHLIKENEPYFDKIIRLGEGTE